MLRKQTFREKFMSQKEKIIKILENCSTNYLLHLSFYLDLTLDKFNVFLGAIKKLLPPVLPSSLVILDLVDDGVNVVVDNMLVAEASLKSLEDNFLL